MKNSDINKNCAGDMAQLQRGTIIGSFTLLEPLCWREDENIQAIVYAAQRIEDERAHRLMKLLSTPSTRAEGLRQCEKIKNKPIPHADDEIPIIVTKWRVLCDCGRVCFIHSVDLCTGEYLDCGCGIHLLNERLKRAA